MTACNATADFTRCFGDDVHHARQRCWCATSRSRGSIAWSLLNGVATWQSAQHTTFHTSIVSCGDASLDLDSNVLVDHLLDSAGVLGVVIVERAGAEAFRRVKWVSCVADIAGLHGLLQDTLFPSVQLNTISYIFEVIKRAAYEVNMEPVASWVTLRQDPRNVVGTVLAVELFDVEVILNKDLREALDIKWSVTTSKTILVDRESHMSPWGRSVKVFAIPATWETDRDSEAIGVAIGEAFGKACVLSIGATVALPLHLATGGTHVAVVRTCHSIAGNHAESLGELASLEIGCVPTCPILVVDTMVWLLWNTDERAVLGVEVKRGHPVIALVCFDRDGAACRGLGGGVVHGRTKSIATYYRVNMVGHSTGRQQRVETLSGDWIPRAEDEVEVALSKSRGCSQSCQDQCFAIHFEVCDSLSFGLCV